MGGGWLEKDLQTLPGLGGGCVGDTEEVTPLKQNARKDPSLPPPRPQSSPLS